MDLVDVRELIGERVFIEVGETTEQFAKAYVGTLKLITSRSVCLEEWVVVEEWDEGHIVSYTDGKELKEPWSDGDIYLVTAGLLQEVRTIEKNLKNGDPYVKS